MDTKGFNAQNGMQLSCSLAYSCKKEEKRKEIQPTKAEYKWCYLLSFAYFLLFFSCCYGEHEMLHQLSANETINSTEDLKGQSARVQRWHQVIYLLQSLQTSVNLQKLVWAWC